MKFTKILSKAYFKIKEIDLKHNVFKKTNMSILELGSGNGGFTQYILENKIGFVLCIDNKKKFTRNFNDKRHTFIKYNIFSSGFIDKISTLYKKNSFDIIISDVCCNITGISDIDSNNFKYMFSKIYPIVSLFLKNEGLFIFKFFNISNLYSCFKFLKELFLFVSYEKLSSSKKKSSEFYSVCKKYFNNVRF